MIDPRDSRTDCGMLLGDPSIPDDVNWDWNLRDRSCVWLDYVDASFSKCQVREIIPQAPVTISVPEECNVIQTNIVAKKAIITSPTLNVYRVNGGNAEQVSTEIVKNTTETPDVDVSKKVIRKVLGSRKDI